MSTKVQELESIVQEQRSQIERVVAIAKELDDRAAYRSGTPAMTSAIAALIRSALATNEAAK